MVNNEVVWRTLADKLSAWLAVHGWDLRSSSWQVLLSPRRARECTREVSGGSASGESEDEAAADERGREGKRKIERKRSNSSAGVARMAVAAAARRWVSVLGARLSIRYVGASTFKMQIRERRSGRKRRRKRKSAGWQVFYWGQLPLLPPQSGRVGSGRTAMQRAADATTQIKSQPPSFNRPLIY